MSSQTRYAKTADGLHIAYQVVGEGPVDLVWVMGWTSNIEAIWEEPNLARFLSYARVLALDPVRQARHGYVRPGLGR